MKKIFVLLASIAGLSACVPYNNYYSANRPGYYPNQYPSYNAENNYSQSYEKNYMDNNYDERSIDEIEMLQQSAVPVQQVRQQTIYQELPQNPSYGMQAQQAQPYYNPAIVPQDARGVVGVGQTLRQPVKKDYDQYQRKKSKLIIAHAWRMAHPSIGKGLELADQKERLDLNTAINQASQQNAVEVSLASMPVTIISLDNSSSANAQGYLCKSVYLVKANGNNIEKMWGQFCRHPNWNEWVLTQW